MPFHRIQGLGSALGTISDCNLLPSAQYALEASRERNAFIIRRTQQIARLFCLLTIGWVLIDLLTIGWPISGALMLARFVTAAAFAALARHRFPVTEKDAFCAVAGLIGTAMAFCLAANVAFWWFQSDQSPFAMNTYLYAPFLIAAGIGIFPLTALECAILALPLIGTMAVSAALWSQFTTSISVEATLWRLALMAAIASFSAMSQLQFLIRFVEQSARDTLTGALTRRTGEELLRSQFAAARRKERCLSVLFVDLDRFKTVNDCFGHDAGDEVLRCTARVLRARLRRQDIVIRWGGEEFVVVLPETDSAGAERVIANIAAAGIGSRPDGAPQTASIGLAERMRDAAADWPALVALADKRMYEAKEAGRNRYVGPDGCSAALFSEPAARQEGRDGGSLGRAA